MKKATIAPETPHQTVAQPMRPAAGIAVAKGLDSSDLFADSGEVLITHGAETYRLRLTRQNRLILTK